MAKPLWSYLAEILGESMDADKAYFDSILDRKGRGSEWEGDPEKVLGLLLFKSTPWTPPAELRPVPGCEYYKVGDGRDSIGSEGIRIVGEDADLGVRIRTGAHGPEIYSEFRREDEILHSVYYGIMIIGPSDSDPSKKVIWTAFPGRLTKMAKREDLDAALALAGEGGRVENLAPFKGCAVKSVRYTSKCPHPGGALRPEICDHCSDLDCRKAAVGY